jgi:hypothetical protein
MSEIHLISVEGTPVYQNKMYTSANAARECPRGNVSLSQNRESGLVRNITFDSSILVYDSSYQNEQGVSSFFKGHIAEVMAISKRHFSDMHILEIGCGKGAFLEALRSSGFDAQGVDPSYEGTSEHIVRKEFSAELGLQGDAIVMRHVLEHIPEPVEFLKEIRNSNGGKGLIYIEVPCFDWILANHAWFDVFYEHVNYFKINDFERMFGNVLSSGHLFGGQYLYVVADLSTLRNPCQTGLPLPAACEIPSNFYHGITACTGLSRQNIAKAVWGAGAKGVTFLHHTHGKGLDIDCVIDINPGKQHLYMAGCGLEVLSPEAAKNRFGEHMDIFVMNSNYLDEIKEQWGLRGHYITVDKIL